MIVNLAVPDELYQAYIKHSPSNPRRAILAQLERHKDSGPNDREIVFTQDQRRYMEGLYGRPIEDVQKFCEWIAGLLTLKVGEASVVLKEGQRKQLVAQAGYWKKNIPQYIRERVSTALGNELGNY
jgi:hypothetical protein